MTTSEVPYLTARCPTGLGIPGWFISVVIYPLQNQTKVINSVYSYIPLMISCFSMQKLIKSIKSKQN